MRNPELNSLEISNGRYIALALQGGIGYELRLAGHFGLYSVYVIGKYRVMVPVSLQMGLTFYQNVEYKFQQKFACPFTKKFGELTKVGSGIVCKKAQA